MREGYLGIDLGGSGVKAGVFERTRGILGGFSHKSYSPRPNVDGHAEIPIEEIYEAARNATREAVFHSGLRIRSLAVSSQGQTFVSLDSEGRPLHPAILWYDSRARRQAAELESSLRRSGVKNAPVVTPICPAAKIMWLRECSPGLIEKAGLYLLLPDYITLRLVGKAVTDFNTAASTGLYAEDAPDYDPSTLELAGIRRAQLAEIVAPGAPLGTIPRKAASDWGLSPETRLVAGTNDQYAGALGAGNFRPGIVSATIGTCLALVTLADDPPCPLPAGLFAGRFPIQRYKFVLAYAKTAGVVLEWFQREFGGNRPLTALSEEAASSPIGSQGITVFPHFEGTVSPRPNPAARGFLGFLELKHRRADLFRAFLESICFSLRENLDFLKLHSIQIECVRAIGGAAQNDLFIQMAADVVGTPIERPVVTDAAVTGAAALAAKGHGDFATVEEACSFFVGKQQCFNPDPRAHCLYETPFQRYLDFARSL